MRKEGEDLDLNINWNPFSPLSPLGDGWLWIILGDYRNSYVSQAFSFVKTHTQYCVKGQDEDEYSFEISHIHPEV